MYTLEKVGAIVDAIIKVAPGWMIILIFISPFVGLIIALITPFAWLFMLICLICPSGREKLAKYATLFPRLRCWQVICLLPLFSVLCFTPTLFALSLIFHWHLAATISLGIVSLSLLLDISIHIALEMTNYKAVDGDKMLFFPEKTQSRGKRNILNKSSQKDDTLDHINALSKKETKNDDLLQNKKA